MLHEETFHRNPSIKIPEQRSRLQLAESTASHIWHRLPLLQVRPGFAWNICKQRLLALEDTSPCCVQVCDRLHSTRLVAQQRHGQATG